MLRQLDNRYVKRRYNAFLVLEGGTLSLPVYIMKLPENGGREAILRLQSEDVEDEILAHFKKNEPVLLKVDVGGGGMDIYSGVLSYSLQTFFHLTNLIFIENLQRRNEVKAPMSQPGMIFCVGPDGDEISLDVQFKNISVGGIGFDLPEPTDLIHVGDTFQMTFEQTKEPFSLLFKVCRILKLPDGSVNCGGQFLKMAVGNEAAIRKYVFDQERKQIIKGKKLQALFEELENFEKQRSEEEKDDKNDKEE